MTRIYTKKGDDGTTSLWYGGRVLEVGRPNRGLRGDRRGRLGARRRALAVRAETTPRWRATSCASRASSFVAGAELATAPEAGERLEDGVSRISDAMVDALDAEIDRYMDRVALPPKFVIPGRHPAVRAARSRPRDPAPRRAPHGGAARREGPRLGGRAALPQPGVGPRLCDGALRRRRRPGAVRGPGRGRRSEGRRAPHQPASPTASRSTATS